MVLHDLDLAARYADELVVMHDGRIVAQGPPCEVLTESLLLALHGLSARLEPDPVGDRPLVVTVGERHVRPGAQAAAVPAQGAV